MFFVVSTGRSGSKTIAQLLSLIGGCVCLHEPPPELIRESSAYRYGIADEAHLEAILKDTRSPRVNGSVYCESSQTLSLILPVLVDVFPQARYIWLMRNGLDTVASAYSKQWYSGHSENHDRYEDCPPLEQAWIDGRIEGHRCGDVSPEQWAALDRFGRCCWYWSYVTRLIESDLQRYASDRFWLVRLETLDRQIPGLLSWMDLQAAMVPVAKRTNVGKREPYPWTVWTAEQRRVFEHWCGDLMDRFYPQWRTPTGEWLGIEYITRSDLSAKFAGIHKLVRLLNAWLAPNHVR
jgi:hypothetical protein